MTKKHHSPNKISLCRYGGIGKHIKQKGNYSKSEESSYHKAPESKGYYAFIFPYVELFLLGSPVNKAGKNGDTNKGQCRGRFVEKEARVYKKFHASSGTIWTHLKPKKRSMIIEEKGSWVKINVSDFSKVLSQSIADEIKGIRTNYSVKLKSPFYYVSKDHMEVFITKDTKINS